MPSLPRTVLVVGTLLASASFAHAGGRAASEVFPSLATLGNPAVAPSAPAAAAPVAAAEPLANDKHNRRLGRRGRVRRYAERRAVRLARDVRHTEAAPASAEPTAPLEAAPAISAPVRGTLPPTEEQAAAPPGQVVSPSSAAEGRYEKAAPTLSALILKHAQQNGVPVELAQAVVRIESRGNARASHGGALGLMQIKPGTARAAGFTGGATGLFSAETNLHFGMKVLGAAYRSAGGDVCRALMQYQSGHLATRMSRANRVYCARARAIMAGA